MIRRARVAQDNRPSHRQLTAKETAHLNNIMATATDLKEDFERCNELKQWFLNHFVERPPYMHYPPSYNIHDLSQAFVADWLKMPL